MTEVEVKILDIDRDAVESRLLSSGANKTFDDEMYAIYLDNEEGTLKKSGDVLRIRKEGDQCILALKKFISDVPAKIRKEIEVTVSDFESLRSVFEQLGFREWLIVKKHRISYELDDVRFEFDKYLDEYDHIPEFLEIEADDIESVYRHVEGLGLTKEDCRPWTFLDVSHHYAHKKK